MKLHEIKPREQNGRDTFGRYRAQVRAAGIAALEILKGESVDRVYCDYHDDFVIRINIGGKTIYNFVQVKTKGKQNENWTLNDIFGLKQKVKDHSKQKNEAIKDSFIGKLLCHTVAFYDTCGKVVFMTNVNLEDNIEEIASDISKGLFENQYSKLLIERFNSCFSDGNTSYSEERVKSLIAKLEFLPDTQYIKEKHNNFEPLARDHIFHYSEIDLEQSESKQVLINLLNLVENKSSGKIHELTEAGIENNAGIGIDDLLEILSISKDAYHVLVSGGDKKAVKSASVIQRAMQLAGADHEEIEFCSRCKTDWDIWLRTNRNIVSEMDLIEITSQIDDILKKVIKNSDSFKVSKLKPEIEALEKSLKVSGKIYDLSDVLILGGFFSALVRFKS